MKDRSAFAMKNLEIDEKSFWATPDDHECAAQHGLIVRYCRPIHIMCSLLDATT